MNVINIIIELYHNKENKLCNSIVIFRKYKHGIFYVTEDKYFRLCKAQNNLSKYYIIYYFSNCTFKLKRFSLSCLVRQRRVNATLKERGCTIFLYTTSR